MKRVTITIPTKLYERMKYEAREGGGNKRTAESYIAWRLGFWHGQYDDWKGETEADQKRWRWR